MAGILVTGATGSVGSNVCAIALERGVEVRALVRKGTDAEPLEALGAVPVVGDVTDRESLVAAATGVDGVIHCAAVIGGTWAEATPAEFDAVNFHGAVNVMDVAQDVGAGRVVSLLSGVVCDPTVTTTERSPIRSISPANSPYTQAKLAAYYEGMARAARGVDVNFVIPGGIYGPTPYPERALVPTIFTGTLLMAAHGEVTRYLPMPLPWVLAADVARVSLGALERGEAGHRYLALGRPEDTCSLPAFCNRFLEMAGIDHRVEEFDPTAPEADADTEFGSMVKLLQAEYPVPSHDPTETTETLGVEPTALEDGLRQTLEFLRRLGKV